VGGKRSCQLYQCQLHAAAAAVLVCFCAGLQKVAVWMENAKWFVLPGMCIDLVLISA
jgi:hypothetical protein